MHNDWIIMELQAVTSAECCSCSIRSWYTQSFEFILYAQLGVHTAHYSSKHADCTNILQYNTATFEF